MRALLDTNVMVDVLQRREPWFEDGQKIFYAIFELVDTLGIDCQNAIAIKNNDYEEKLQRFCRYLF